MSGGTRPEPSALELALFREWIETRSGLFFSESRERLLVRSLGERMAATGARTFGAYYQRLASGQKLSGSPGEAEGKQLVEQLLNHETGFFRHPPSFAALSGPVVKELAAERLKRGIHSFTAWSAGCATGEEAYSLAMTLLETLGPAGWEVRVCGSDLSEAALAQARRGRYKASRARHLPEELRERYWVRREEALEIRYEAKPRLRQVVQLGRLNLADPGDYWVGAQDVIFCQNVLLYFRPERRLEVAAALVAKLRPGGVLFLAPGELLGLTLPGVTPWRLDGCLAYRRTEPAPRAA